MNKKTANKKYNPNSNITHLRRMGKSLQGGACIDNVSFTYSGNQLSAAQDTGIPASLMGDAFHFVDGDDYYSEYGYDGCGALTSDSNKGVYKILYDFNGMPTCVWFDNGSITDYVYTADGVKLKTVHRTAVPGTVPSGSTPSLSEQNTLSKDSTLYVGALEVESSIREKYYYANGYLDIVYGNLDSYNYYATDHLGNVRHVARATPSGVGSIIQTNNYYPFGGLLNEGDNQLYVQRKLYNGKEYDRMQGLNLYDYGARQYDPAICRFTSMDPLCEKYYHISPYAYCGGNPMKYVDPDGKDFNIRFTGDEVIIEADYYVSSSMSDLEKEEVQNSISEWNKYSEKNWKYKDDEGNKYKIRVNLKMVELSPEEFAEKEQRFIDKKELSSEYEGNTISFGEVEQYGKNNEVVTGVTNSGRAIIIDRELKGFMTMQHEIGHSLSLGHDYSGLMTAKSNDPNRADGFLTKSDFVKIINNVYNIKPVNAKGYIIDST